MHAHARRSRRPRGTPSARPSAERLEWPRAWPAAILAGWTALLLLSPPHSNAFWAVNGFRSVSLESQALLLVAASILGWLITRARGTALWTAISVPLAWIIAFPLREKIHLLGDIELRVQTISSFSERWTVMFGERWTASSIAHLTQGLHAMPLDLVLGFFAPVALHRGGFTLRDSVSIVSFVMAVVFMLGVWRLTSRLNVPERARIAMALVLGLSGILEAFAGYAESTGLLLALAPWWWAELLTPIDHRRQGIRIAIAWGVLMLAHRMALVMLIPMVWRASGPALAGDTARGRRTLAIGTGATAIVASFAMVQSIGTRQVGTDFGDVFALFRGAEGIGLLSVIDTVNLFALVVPLVVLAIPLCLGVMREWLRTPVAKLVLIAGLSLVPLALLLPAGPNGLGAHRDWDLAALCGWTLTLAAVTLLKHLKAGALRGGLAVMIPVLALGAGQWLMVNADERASENRAQVLADGTAKLAPPHLGSLLVYLGRRAMDHGQPEPAGPYFERAYESSPNPRFLLLAAEARLAAGNLPAARENIARAQASGGLNERGLHSMQIIEQMIAQAEAVAAPGPAR